MDGRLHLSVVLVASLLPTIVAAQEGTDRVLKVRESRVELVVTLDYDEGSLSGVATYDILNVSASSADEVPFNLNRLMTVSEIRDAGGLPVAFTQDVTQFTDSPRRQVNHILVPLSVPLAPGEQTRLSVEFAGHLVGYTETGSLYIRDRIHEDFSILRADAYAFPVVGHATSRVNRAAPRISFDFEIRITVPERFTVASGGGFVGRSEGHGMATYVYQSAAPAPFLNIPIAEYRLVEKEGVRVYYFPEDSVGAAVLLDRADRGLSLLTEWFGPMGRDLELAVMEIPDGWGSQASLTGGIIQTASAFRELGQMRQLYHELTHIWNAPDTDLPSARWNEGLASFLERRMAWHLDGWNGIDSYAQQVADRLVAAIDARPEIASIPFQDYGSAGLTDLSYRTGFLTFYLLHSLLGDAEFDAAVGGYYQERRETGGTFEDLVDSFKGETSLDLVPFFEKWVYTTQWYQDLKAGSTVAELLDRAR